MFVTKKEFVRVVTDLQRDIESLRTIYLASQAAHYRLLNHLGLQEEEVPERIRIRKRRDFNPPEEA
jgi:hypothetical protein